MIEKTEETVYALRHIKAGKLLTYIESSNDGGDFCNSTRVDLDHNDYGNINTTWYTDAAWKAEYVRQFSTEWYNSGLECPRHGYEPEELEIIEVYRIITTKKVESHVPSLKEYFKIRYEKKDPEHYASIMNEMESTPLRNWGNYSRYELEELIQEGKWSPLEETDVSQNNKYSKKSS